MKKIYLYNRWLWSSVFTILVYFTMPVRARYALGLSDASIFEYFGYAMSNGEVLYRDLFDHKGPIVFIINYFGYILNGEFGIKIVYLICIFIFFYTSILIARLFTNERNSIIVLVVIFVLFENFFELGWGIEGYVLPVINYSLYIYIKYFLVKRVSRLEILLVGASLALVFFTRANMIGIWLIFSLYVLVDKISKKQYKELATFTMYFILGIFLVIIPLGIYLSIKGVLSEMIYQSFTMNFIYAKNQGLGKRKILEWFIETANGLNISLIFFGGVVISYRKYGRRILFLTIAIGLCLVFALLSKRPYLHYLLVLIPLVIPILSIILESSIFKVNIVYILLGIYIIYYTPIQNILTNIENRNYNYFNDEVKIAQYVKNNTANTDRIYSHRMQGLIYLEAERLANSKFFFIPSLEDETPIIDDVRSSFEKRAPKYIIFDERYDYKKATDYYIKAFIEKNYKEEYSIKTIKVYKLVI